MAVRCEGVICPLHRKQFGTETGLPRPASGVLRVLLGIGGGLRITTDDDALTPVHLNQRPEKKERRAWEIFNAEKFFGSAELTSRALQKAT
jgi:hypothetical protein